MKSIGTSSSLLVAGVVTSILIGCTQHQPPVHRTFPYGDHEVYIASADLAEAVVFGPTPTVINDGRGMEVAVPFTSLGNERYIIDHRFVWYDINGFELQPSMGWREVVFEPGQRKMLQTSSPDGRAARWRLEVKWANR